MSNTNMANETQSGSGPSKCSHDCIEDIVRHNIQIDQYFFDKAAMRFFSSRILPTVYDGRIFVTSEQDTHENGAWNGERRYTVRECVNGQIKSRSEHGAFASAQDAKNAARELAAASELRTIFCSLEEMQGSLELVSSEDAFKVL